MTMHYANGTMVQAPTFANDPAFNPQWEQLQKELGEVLRQANSSTPANTTHAFFGACRSASNTINRLMHCQQTPPAKP